jgi:DNA-binding NarL/FixJ family response regulator
MTRVVLAEDHGVLRDGLRRLLESHGHTVVAEVDDGLRVVDVVGRIEPDVLLLDLGLPGLHGLDIVPEIKRRTPRTRVLVLSAESRDDFVLSALRNGAAGYVLKNSPSQDLMTGITAVMQGRHYVSSELAETLVRLVSQAEDAQLSDPYEMLSHREREVLHLMAEGLSNAAIGERLFISPRTVETPRANILRDLGLKSQSDVVRYALRRGIIAI